MSSDAYFLCFYDAGDRVQNVRMIECAPAEIQAQARTLLAASSHRVAEIWQGSRRLYRTEKPVSETAPLPGPALLRA